MLLWVAYSRSTCPPHPILENIWARCGVPWLLVWCSDVRAGVGDVSGLDASDRWWLLLLEEFVPVCPCPYFPALTVVFHLLLVPIAPVPIPPHLSPAQTPLPSRVQLLQQEAAGELLPEGRWHVSLQPPRHQGPGSRTEMWQRLSGGRRRLRLRGGGGTVLGPASLSHRGFCSSAQLLGGRAWTTWREVFPRERSVLVTTGTPSRGLFPFLSS